MQKMLAEAYARDIKTRIWGGPEYVPLPPLLSAFSPAFRSARRSKQTVLNSGYFRIADGLRVFATQRLRDSETLACPGSAEITSKRPQRSVTILESF
jgi:hypothetical protein